MQKNTKQSCIQKRRAVFKCTKGFCIKDDVHWYRKKKKKKWWQKIIPWIKNKTA